MSKYEIQVMRSDDDGPMVLVGRGVVIADSVPEAASRYAITYDCSKEPYTVKYTSITDALIAISDEWQSSSSRAYGDVVQEVMLHCTAAVRSELRLHTGVEDPASAGALLARIDRLTRLLGDSSVFG